MSFIEFEMKVNMIGHVQCEEDINEVNMILLLIFQQLITFLHAIPNLFYLFIIIKMYRWNTYKISLCAKMEEDIHCPHHLGGHVVMTWSHVCSLMPYIPWDTTTSDLSYSLFLSSSR